MKKCPSKNPLRYVKSLESVEGLFNSKFYDKFLIFIKFVLYTITIKLTIGDQQDVTYRDILKDIRLSFPQPVADPIHNSYFVHSIMRALDQVDELKTHLPMLGNIIPADFEEARQAALPETMSSIEDVTTDLVGYLRGMTIFGHPRTQRTLSRPQQFRV